MQSGGIADKGMNSQYDLASTLSNIVKDSLSSGQKNGLRIEDPNNKNDSLGLSAANQASRMDDKLDPAALADFINAQLGRMGGNVNQIV